MDYEKKYKQLHTFISDLYPFMSEYCKEKVEDFFPELAESDDERIRKALIRFHKSTIDVDGIKGDDIIAWLEKQGEKKLCVNDNAKEMFIKALERVEEQNNKGYKLTDCDKNSWWEDFKAYTSCTIVQKPADKSKIKPKFKTGDRVIGIVSGMPYFITEVCDDHYYTESGCMIMFCSQDNFELYKHPTWGEDDEKIALSIEQVMNCASLLNIVPEKIDKIRTWLKSIKERVQSLPRQEWSEEDEKHRLNCLSYFNMIEKTSPYYEDYLWLKSLKEKYSWKPSDEQMLALEWQINNTSEGSWQYEESKNLLKQLEKLKR